MRSLLKIAILATSTLCAAMPVFAKPKPGEAIGYFLPRTEVDVIVSQRIISCPAAEEKLEIATDVAIEPSAVPGEFVNVDIRSGLFAERSTKLTLRPNGTLEAFNASTAGQGGKILGAISKAAFNIAGSGWLAEIGEVNKYVALMNVADTGDAPQPAPVPATPLTCKKDVLDALAAITSKQSEIKTIEQRMAKEGGKPGDEELLERRRTQIAKLKDALTLTSDVTIDPQAPKSHLDAVDYLEWFEDNANLSAALRQNEVVGRMGFAIAVKPDQAVLRQAGQGDGTVIKSSAPYLVYRRPVPAAIMVKPCAEEQPTISNFGQIAQDVGNAKLCNIDTTPEAKAIYSGDIVQVPQLSQPYSLRIGRGGLFGSKEAGAKFDEYGTPLELEYGTSTGTEQAAELIDGSADGLLSARDAELAELERQIKLTKARKELADLKSGDNETDD